MANPICPANKEHGEMVEVMGTGMYYCYDCHQGRWLRESRRQLERLKEQRPKNGPGTTPLAVMRAYWMETLDMIPEHFWSLLPELAVAEPMDEAA